MPAPLLYMAHAMAANGNASQAAAKCAKGLSLGELREIANACAGEGHAAFRAMRQAAERELLARAGQAIAAAWAA